MLKSVIHKKKLHIAAYLLAAMFFSCGNNIKEVQDFLAEKDLPVAIAKNVNMIHTDSGLVKTRLITPVLNDFSNIEAHPYQEFPKGLEITSFDEADSTTLVADYARTYGKTAISEVVGNVIVTNHKDNSRLYTEQLYWDQNTHYIYTEKPFKLITKTDTINGRGFESNEDLTKRNMRNISGIVYLNENN